MEEDKENRYPIIPSHEAKHKAGDKIDFESARAYMLDANALSRGELQLFHIIVNGNPDLHKS